MVCEQETKLPQRIAKLVPFVEEPCRARIEGQQLVFPVEAFRFRNRRNDGEPPPHHTEN